MLKGVVRKLSGVARGRDVIKCCRRERYGNKNWTKYLRLVEYISKKERERESAARIRSDYLSEQE